ncbi:NADH-quinone oxidoreductase subunit NuoE [Geobacter sp. SVR]|uniref:NADH-quinone oxidoreductase subunit NuoE n=1 Tax=Geobacter sp. SVR TaxID=2495594 RepID=UPI00143EFFC5|nr:NADH-quinone oxidoreductase subunit NuoE [Geobacter sp. SVR]BCS52975.1 NADH-quinone oxidoreductase subunit E [Geobacter sp. SVR]GCF84359.1 NADH-quinone oxidoreductase subunit E [Geobacter sp. SVR]
MIPQALKQELLHRVKEAITPREAAVDVMKALQQHYGWLTDEAVGEAADVLGLSPLQVEELATFYEMIYRRPVGRTVIHVCDSISCWAMGGETLLKQLEQRLNVSAGGTTDDGSITLVPCSCLGNCGDGPALMIGDRLYGPVSMEKAEQIISGLPSAP